MLTRWKRLSWARRAILLVPLAGLVLLAAAYGYFAFRTAGAPAEASLGEAPRSGQGDLDGDWVLPRQNAGFVGYRVREKIGLVPAPNDAVGRTSSVQGRMTIKDGRIESAEVVANLTTLKSDQEGRDPAAQDALNTAQFPNGKFRLTEPVDLREPGTGQVMSFSAKSEVTIRGVSKVVKFPLQARWNGDTFEIAGQLEIERSDFELEFPQQLGMRVSDSAKIEVELTFVHRGAGAPSPPPPATTTGETATESPAAAPQEPKATGPGRLLVSMTEKDHQTVVIYSVNVDGSHLRRLVRPLHRSGYWSVDLSPKTSPDGSKIAYSRGIASEGSGEPDQLYVLPTGSARPKRLTDDTFAANIWPSWSPDSSKLAFVRAGATPLRSGS